MKLNLKNKKDIDDKVLRTIIQYGLGFASRVKTLEEKCIDDWKSDKLYDKSSFVIYDGYIWKAKVTNQSSIWDEKYWNKIGDELSLVELDDIKAMLNLTDEQLKTLSSLILDSEIRLDKTWSSSKIYSDIQQCLSDSKVYTLQELAKKTGASYKIVTSTTDMTSTEFLYLLSNANNAYDIYALIDGTATKIGDTTIDLSNFYTKNEIDNDFLKKTDANSKFATITTVDKKVDKTSILTTISSTPSDDKLLSEKAIGDTFVKKTDIVDNLTYTDTDKPLSANQGKVLKDEIDLKANENDVIKKTDITTTIDSTSKDSEIATAKAVNDLLQTESPGNLTIPLNEDLNNLIYNRTRVWMNSQTVQIATFTNMPSGRFTECAVIFIPYENATSDYGEQIFVGNYNRIFIRNKINTTWTAWQKICTTSSVADVAPTAIKFTSTTNYKPSTIVPLRYTIMNGICYVSGGINCVSPASNETLVYTLPKPKAGNQYCKTMGVASASDTNTVTMIIGLNGELNLTKGVAGGEYRCTFSYPVE